MSGDSPSYATICCCLGVHAVCIPAVSVGSGACIGATGAAVLGGGTTAAQGATIGAVGAAVWSALSVLCSPCSAYNSAKKYQANTGSEGIGLVMKR